MTLNRHTLVAAVLLAVSGQADAAGQAGATAGGMQRVAIIDPSGFEKPLPAHWVQIPAGWRTQGGVLWDPNAPCGATPSFRWQASSPDGSQVLAIHPTEAWTWDNLNLPVSGGRCPRAPIMNVRQYLESFVQRNRPGARILDYRARPDLVRFPPPPDGNGMRFRKEGGELLVAYGGPQGGRRESVAAVVLFSHHSMAGVMPGEVREFMSGTASAPTTLSAPAGQLDMRLLTHVATTGQPDPQWQARMNKHHATIARQNTRGAADRSAIIANTYSEISDMQMQGWRDRNASSDRMQQATVDGINNVQRYADPATGDQVQLDNRYDHAWRTADGTYLQTNDPNFNPNTDLGVDAEAMERDE